MEILILIFVAFVYFTAAWLIGRAAVAIYRAIHNTYRHWKKDREEMRKIREAQWPSS